MYIVYSLHLISSGIITIALFTVPNTCCTTY